MTATKELILNYLESEHITIGDPELEGIISKWESHFPCLNFISLAALVLENPKETNLSKTEIRKIRDFYFPHGKYCF